MSDPLATYRQMRDPGRTPEPVPPSGPLPEGNDDTFVIQEHHARRLHWDVRLERDGVLVSWAVPKGLPLDPKTNHLAVHTEDHPIEYATFEGEIPRGEYGGGKVVLWDRGRYELEKWTDREVKVVFHGARAQGRYVFLQTRGRDWMVHRMDPPPVPDWEPVPVGLRPMLPSRGDLPPRTERTDWAYEMAWGGVRLLVAVEGGRARVTDARGEDVSPAYPELRGLGPALGSRAALFDGEVVALGRDGRPNPALLRRRPTGTAAPDRRTAAEVPLTYLAFDLLHLDGRDPTGLPYEARRELLDAVGLDGERWSVAPSLRGDGREALAASRDLGLGGIVAKRLGSTYEPGRRSPDWRLVDNREPEQVVVGGRIADESGALRALVVGRPGEGGLRYLGIVRSGLGADREELARLLSRLGRKTSPFIDDVPVRGDVHWVRPTLSGQVVAGRTGALSWRGFT
ncbi:MAG TPA: DNA polymerase ligase N-terminal domain-containing protein [Mycobacteriales bacterium]|nr:DNA polymerase ligase N-terminal domain-containing protein [Mycobacteriales bacterium]